MRVLTTIARDGSARRDRRRSLVQGREAVIDTAGFLALDRKYSS
jgi:hypothetical protein